jgi:hypothetical protein
MVSNSDTDRCELEEVHRVEQEQRAPGERGRKFISELIPEWTPTRNQALWTVRITLALIILVSLLELIADYYDKTLWDWLDLLIVPAAIAGGIAWFNQQQQKQQDKRDQEQREHDALQAYLDQIGTLLLQKKLHIADDTDDARKLARARTLTVLDMLSPARKPRALEFLFEMGLIQTIPPNREPVISLRFAILRKALLANRHLLKSADLDRATLDGANLTNANLSNAILTKARLIGADLTEAKLINANLAEARLIKTDLTEADLSGADLSGADLSGARGITSEELEQRAKSLKGTIMPDGSKHD